MALKPPTEYSKEVRETLNWLVAAEHVDAPMSARGEPQYLLCHARRLHDSFVSLPAAAENRRCLVVGSWGIEVPYLAGRLGWTDITCICAPTSRRGVTQRLTRTHPNGDGEFSFDLIEHDLESGALPFDDDTFGLVVFWGCFEHLRHDPEFGLYEINRVTARGGVVSVVTDNAISFQMTHSVLRGEPMPMRLHHPAAEGHWRLYTPPELESLLSGTGWRVDTLTTIVPDPPVYWRWWKRWLFRRLVSDYRRGFGLNEPYWDAFILANAVKIGPPARRYPKWLYKDEKIAALRLEMIDYEGRRSNRARSA
ncbi:MAG TPA: class I SAM-dependent methyltransferase [Phycisphaerae bacterium]|nr:class I SAM-dependent methyltransferase [Phycisphaerae bacterium]HRW54702.1 class I SAM-dependent methyltransferase [Phycisphaerae bacterium]